MQGVEILTATQVVSETAFNWNVFCATMSVISGFGLILGILVTLGNDLEWFAAPILWFVVTAFGCWFGFMVGYYDRSIPTNYETQYKVTISDQVSMTEFYEHYEVIDQDGKIFTVRERTE